MNYNTMQMREIMFRGKRLDNGKWIEGHLIRCENGRTRICESKTDIFCYEKDCSIIQTVAHETETFTVGQYTGLKDKNGKRIFEGDMIKPFDEEIDKMVVEFHHGQFLLCLYGERGYMAEYGWEEEGNYGCFEAESLSSYGDDIEVIGNIHDNPELLEGGGE